MIFSLYEKWWRGRRLTWYNEAGKQKGGGILPRIPDFIDGYYLPPGIYDCSMEDIEERFLSTDRRKVVWAQFNHFLERLQSLNIFPETILIDGSFVTGREEPGDVDVCILVPPEKMSAAYHSLDNEEDKESLRFIFNQENQAALRLAFGTHPIIVPDEAGMDVISDVFRTGGGQFGHLRSPDRKRDPDWVVVPLEKGILKVNLQRRF